MVVAVSLVACGGGKDPPAVTLIDGAPDGVPVPVIDASVLIDAAPFDGPFGTVCNPLTQAGCGSGEKCTWINDQDNPPIGHIGCAPDGVTSIGAACTEGPAGPFGYDNCAKGSVCLAGVCKSICDPQGGAPACTTTEACTNYANLFVAGGFTLAGVCDPGCDPLTQDLRVGTATTACGSTNPSMPTRGCYGYNEFSCAPVSTSTLSLTDRASPHTNGSGNPYLNGCAPGFIPMFFEGTGSMQVLCSGFCAALETDNTPAHVGNAKGDPTALAKLPLQPAPIAGDGTCEVGKKGSLASSACKFVWPFVLENGVLPPTFATSPLLDTLGVCMAIDRFYYDADANPATGINGAEAPYPDCATLPPPSGTTTGVGDDAGDWFCAKYSAVTPFTSSVKIAPAMRDVRIGTTAPIAR